MHASLAKACSDVQTPQIVIQSCTPVSMHGIAKHCHVISCDENTIVILTLDCSMNI